MCDFFQNTMGSVNMEDVAWTRLPYVHVNFKYLTLTLTLALEWGNQQLCSAHFLID